MERVHPNFIKGYAYIEYEKPDDAEKAIKYMNGGILIFRAIPFIRSMHEFVYWSNLHMILQMYKF